MKLSVAIITYNQERFIRQAIESALAQNTNFEYEIIIGEDGSTDGTRAVIMDLHRRYPGRIEPILRDQNVGAMRNFAETIASCRGQYIALLEGDDYWTSPDKLQKQVDFLDAHPDCALCCHRVRYLNETGYAEFDVFPPCAAGTYSLEDLLNGNFIMTCSTVLRRDLVPRFPDWFFEMRLGDWPLFAMVATYGKIELLDELMANYRVHSGATWSSLPYITRFLECTRMLRALDRELDYRYTRAIRRKITLLFVDLAVAARANGSRAETARYLFDYIRSGGLRLPGNRRLLAGLAAYILIGRGYKVFSRARATNGN